MIDIIKTTHFIKLIAGIFKFGFANNKQHVIVRQNHLNLELDNLIFILYQPTVTLEYNFLIMQNIICLSGVKTYSHSILTSNQYMYKICLHVKLICLHVKFPTLPFC